MAWLIRRAYVALVLVALSTMANALSTDPLRWDLSGVTFEDGATATGWFTWDATAAQGSQLLDFDILVAGGNTAQFPAFRYTTSNTTQDGALASWSGVAHLDNGDFPVTFLRFYSTSSFEGRMRELRLVFSPMLTNVGGSTSILLVDPKYGTLIPGECYSCGPWRAIVSGAAVAAIPEPSTYTLMAAGLFVVGLAVRRRVSKP